jgi:hypothetical protein
MSVDRSAKLTPNTWRVRSIWASTDFRFQQCSWPFAVFVLDDERVSLQTSFPWDKNWTRTYEEIQYVLFNGKSFFIVATDLTYGRIIGSWKLVNLAEHQLLAKKVRVVRTNESLNLLLSLKKRQRLSHFPFED